MANVKRKSPPETQTIRLSLTWVIAGLLIVLVVGALGGVLAGQWARPVVPLTGNADQLITTVQEVTISPNTVVADIVGRTHRSVVLLGPAGQNGQVTATGLVITNDGLMVTSSNVSGIEAVAYDQEGRQVPLETVGSDTLFGLTYFRLGSGVFVPLELEGETPSVGEKLLVLSRSGETFAPRAETFTVSEHALPGSLIRPGIQRLLKGTPSPNGSLRGSPLLDEEGKTVGLMLDNQLGLALPAGALRVSMDRVLEQRREFDPFLETGISLAFEFGQLTEEAGRQFLPTVQAVGTGTPAAIAGVQAGDKLTVIGDQVVNWDTNVASQLSQSLPFSITVHRQGQEHVLTLNLAPQSTTP